MIENTKRNTNWSSRVIQLHKWTGRWWNFDYLNFSCSDSSWNLTKYKARWKIKAWDMRKRFALTIKNKFARWVYVPILARFVLFSRIYFYVFSCFKKKINIKVKMYSAFDKFRLSKTEIARVPMTYLSRVLVIIVNTKKKNKNCSQTKPR